MITHKRLFVAALFTLFAVGCGLIPRVTYEAVEDARKRGDEGYLDQACRAEIVNGQVREHACGARDRLREKGQALAAPCPEVIDRYRQTSAKDAAFVTAMAEKVTGCGRWDFFFEHMVHFGNRDEGVEVLAALEARGKPVEAELVKYLEAHRGARYFPVEKDRGNDVIYGLAHLTRWLVKKGRRDLCAPFSAAAIGANDTARGETLRYFQEARCKEGMPAALDALSSDAWVYRALACDTLGLIGDASAIEKMTILANTDGHTGNLADPFPVRRACLAAVGKIQLRK